jgi:GNAT superfamily N-acetyltransferase
VIRELSESELPEAAALAAAAFRDDPGFAYILPDDAQRRRRLPSLLEALLRVDAASGGAVSGAFEDGALIGVSAVLPARVANPELPDWIKHLPSLAWLLARPAALLRALALIRAVEKLRAKDFDYLHLLAVHPATQGRGVGAALLNAAPKTLYVETFTESNRAWYEARGFALLMEVRSPSRPAFWTLRRSR